VKSKVADMETIADGRRTQERSGNETNTHDAKVSNQYDGQKMRKNRDAKKTKKYWPIFR